MATLWPLFMGDGGSNKTTIEVSSHRSLSIDCESREVLVYTQPVSSSGLESPTLVNERTIIIGEQMRTIFVADQSRSLDIPSELRIIYVEV